MCRLIRFCFKGNLQICSNVAEKFESHSLSRGVKIVFCSSSSSSSSLSQRTEVNISTEKEISARLDWKVMIIYTHI